VTGKEKRTQEEGGYRQRKGQKGGKEKLEEMRGGGGIGKKKKQATIKNLVIWPLNIIQGMVTKKLL
jgi:hypothetical protein